MHKLYYTLQIDLVDCNFDLFINKIKIDDHRYNYPRKVEIPINYWLKNGMNTLTAEFNCKSLENFSPNSYCNITVYVRQNNDNREKRMPVGSIKFDPNDEKTPQSSLIQFSSFEAQLAFEEHLWYSTESFKTNDKNYREILKIYTKFHRCLSKKDIRGLLELTYNKDWGMAKSLYTSFEKYIERNKKLFEEEFNNHNNILVKLKPQLKDGLTMNLYCDNRLTCLTNIEHNSPLFMYNTELDLHTYFDIMVCKLHDEFVIIR